MEKTIKERKESFWGESRFHDVSFAFKDCDKTLRANKMILSLVSPVFEVMFFGDFEKKDPVIIEDISYEIFHEFLYFIYTEKFNITSLEEAEQLFLAADMYDVASIRVACERYIIKNIKSYNIEEVFKFAEMFSLKDLMRLSRLLKDYSRIRDAIRV